MNENGTINTRRLQLVLDEMKLWEQEVFQKEYADLNWYKGKQAKHVREMELGEKRSKLGTSLPRFPFTFTYHVGFTSLSLQSLPLLSERYSTRSRRLCWRTARLRR